MNRPRQPLPLLVGLIFAVVMVSQVFLFRGGKPGRSQVGSSPTAVKPAVRPLDQELRRSTSIERGDGVALAILLDTSGSMNDAVAGGQGGRQPKIEIAQRCLLSVVNQCDAFARQHPDKKVLLGIYDSSVREGQPLCRLVVPLGPPDLAAATPAVHALHPGGGTPIGEAMVAAKKDLNATGLTYTHILVVTDGQSNHGTEPEVVARAISNLPDEDRSSLYFIAFDVAAQQFNAIRDAGGMVLAAAGAQDLQQALDYLLAGKILAEEPAVPAARP